MSATAPTAPTAAGSSHAGIALGRRVSERLAVLCWCQKEVVHVPASEIKAGRTGSCERPGCQP